MKRPILRVRKGSESYDDHAVYSSAQQWREEDTTPQVPGRSQRRGLLFKMARGSLLPVLILVVIAVVFLRVVPQFAARANIDGWHAVLEAHAKADMLEVGVAFSRLNHLPESESGPPVMVTIRFMLPDTGERTEAFGTLAGQRVALRSLLHYASSERTLRATVTVKGESRVLSLSLGSSYPGP